MANKINKYLLFLTKDYSFPILKPLYNSILNNDRGEVFWFSINSNRFGTTKDIWIESNDNVMQYNPDVIFAPGNIVPYHWPGLKVQIFHGLGEEKHGHYRLNGLFNMYCTPGPLITEKFNSKNKNGKYIIIETGWPKLDYINTEENIKSSIFENDFPTILYAPTFSKKLTSAYKLFDIIRSLQKLDYNWIIKFHELMDKSLLKQYSTLESDKFKIVADHNILENMIHSDVLLTDTSSVAYEYLLFDKPIITFNAKTRIDKGINIFSPLDLEGAILRVLNDPNEFRDNRMFYLNELHPYVDGKSSVRILDAVSEVLKNEQPSRNKLNTIDIYNRWKTRRLVS
ncbi:CDP-glycerol glycerophosphotransferase family protein [Candidatus Neomarinimicrobiota bacterium]